MPTLTNSQINSKVMATCIMFAKNTASLSKNLAAADPDLVTEPNGSIGHAAKGSSVQDPASMDKLMDILKRFEDHFGRHLKILLDALNYLAATETVVFLSLCARLSMANEGIAGAGPSAAYG